MSINKKVLAVAGALVIVTAGVAWAVTASSEGDQGPKPTDHPETSAIRIVESAERTDVWGEPADDGSGMAIGVFSFYVENTSDWIATDFNVRVTVTAPDGTVADSSLIYDRGHTSEFLAPGARIGVGHQTTWAFEKGDILDPAITDFDYSYEVRDNDLKWIAATPELTGLTVEFSNTNVSGTGDIIDPIVVEGTVTTGSEVPVMVDTVSAIIRYEGEIIGGVMNSFVLLDNGEQFTTEIKKGDEYRVKAVLIAGDFYLEDIDVMGLEAELFLANDPREETGF